MRVIDLINDTADQVDSVAVLGPGAVGGLIAGLLRQHDVSVTCVSNPRREGTHDPLDLVVSTPALGEFTTKIPYVTSLREPVDICFVTVKAPSLQSSLQRLPVDLMDSCLVIPLLNGLEHLSLIRDTYPNATVAAGTIKVEALRTAPNHVSQVSPFIEVELAFGDASADARRRIEALTRLLDRSSIATNLLEREAAVLWRKFAFLAPLALTTGATSQPIGWVRTADRARLLSVVREVCAVAVASGAEIEFASVVDALDRAPEGMSSSLQRDLSQGKPSEIDAVGGSLLRAAARSGVDVATSAALVEQILGSLQPRDAIQGEAGPA